MKTRNKTVTAEFGENKRFASPIVATTTPELFRGALDTELDRLRDKLLATELARTINLEANVLLRRAANDAVALVWLTPFPLLLLPALFAEKALAARRVAGRQALIRERTSELLALAE
ncbi:MAG: hypothetical protein DVB33_00190 [Verrucomicrobia bacterium]|jgi:hypothetical protein|nr:MAG: hypothetical protein DVB33_00190 [Verrucomicrobiota bacterium]